MKIQDKQRTCKSLLLVVLMPVATDMLHVLTGKLDRQF